MRNGLLLGEVVLVADAERGGAAGVDGGGQIVVAVAEDDLAAVEAGSLGKRVEHFGGRGVGGTIAYLVAVGDSD